MYGRCGPDSLLGRLLVLLIEVGDIVQQLHPEDVTVVLMTF